jgi:Tfp pilus assembly protein PilO
MNLGIAGLDLNIEQAEEDITNALVAELQALESLVEMETVFTDLQRYMEVSTNMESLSAAVSTHGITDTVVTLVGKEIEAHAAGFCDKNVTAMAGITTTIEAVNMNLGELLKKAWEALKKFFNDFFDFLTKANKFRYATHEKVKKMGKKSWVNPDLEVPDIFSCTHNAISMLAKLITVQMDVEKMLQAFQSGTWKLSTADFDAFKKHVEVISKDIKEVPMVKVSTYSDINKVVEDIGNSIVNYKKRETSLKAVQAIINKIKIKNITVAEGSEVAPQTAFAEVKGAVTSVIKAQGKAISVGNNLLKNIKAG